MAPVYTAPSAGSTLLLLQGPDKQGDRLQSLLETASSKVIILGVRPVHVTVRGKWEFTSGGTSFVFLQATYKGKIVPVTEGGYLRKKLNKREGREQAASPKEHAYGSLRGAEKGVTHPHRKLLSVSTDGASKRSWTGFFGLLEVKFLRGRPQSLDTQQREPEEINQMSWCMPVVLALRRQRQGGSGVLVQPWDTLDLSYFSLWPKFSCAWDDRVHLEVLKASWQF